ncbi:MAG: hypothetical protein ACOC56_06125, partial [Atribacterota bacterium]
DDISSTMLFIAMILILKESSKIKFKEQLRKTHFQIIFVVWFSFTAGFLPKSNLRKLREAIPDKTDIKTLEEIRKVRKITENKSIAVQDVLGPHFYRKKIEIVRYRGKNKKEKINFGTSNLKNMPLPDFIVLAPSQSHYLISDMDKCIREFNKSKKYVRKNNFDYLYIYKKGVNE